MNRAAGLERGLAVAKGPGSRLLLTRSEERDQAEGFLESSHDLIERRGALAKRRGLFVGELCQLGLELAVDSAGPVDDRDQRLRRQRVELIRQLARPLSERVARLEMRQDAAQDLRLFADPGVTRLRLLLDPLEPLRDMIGVRDEQLELERLDLAVGIGGAGESVRDREKRIDLAETAEERGARTGNVLHPNGGGSQLLRTHEIGEPFEPVVGDRRHADVRLVCHRRIGGDLRARLRESVEECGLACVGQTDDADLECHGGEG